MKQLKLPFEIGQKYEELEFDLEVLGFERIPNYDSYLYVGEVKNFLNFISDKTELIFYWDRLEVVVLTFLNKELIFFENINEGLKIKFNESQSLIKSNSLIHKYKDLKITYWVIYATPNKILVLYGRPRNLEQIFNTLSLE